MKYLVFIVLIISGICSSRQVKAQLYVCKEVKATLYSEAPVENIEAVSVRGVSVVNLLNGDVQFSIPISSFQFKKSLMQEHFNENYMESDKFPNAKFRGHINEKINTAKDGEYPVTVSGELEVHGVKKQRTIPGTIKVMNNSITVSSRFNVLCKDHNITIPRLVFKNIAESIQVTILGSYTPYQTPKS